MRRSERVGVRLLTALAILLSISVVQAQEMHRYDPA